MGPVQEDALAGRRVRGRGRRGEGNGGGKESRRGDADGAVQGGAGAEFFEVSLSPPLAKLSKANRLFVTPPFSRCNRMTQVHLLMAKFICRCFISVVWAEKFDGDTCWHYDAFLSNGMINYI